MSTTSGNNFRRVTAENCWHVLRGLYGRQLQAASVSVLLIQDDGTVKFETVSMPMQTSIDAAIAKIAGEIEEALRAAPEAETKPSEAQMFGGDLYGGAVP